MITCHKLVAREARKMAQLQWEELATKSNQFYAKNPSVANFVAASWPLYVPVARAILIQMLGSDLLERLKRPIYEAIIAEKSSPGPQYRGLYVPQDIPLD